MPLCFRFLGGQGLQGKGMDGLANAIDRGIDQAMAGEGREPGKALTYDA